MSDVAQCRSCGSGDLHPFLSLGKTPLADALVKPGFDVKLEERFPLDVAFCAECSLVQLLEEVPADKMFVDNYLYFSSFSDELLRHSRENVLRLIAERRLGPSSLVVEIASNDGYLLKNFAEFGVPVLGVDPAPDQAAAANAAGVPTLARFFGSELAQELVADGKRADVIVANNVMAHVPGLNDVMAGVATLLADDGVAVIENPYVRDLIDHVEFDRPAPLQVQRRHLLLAVELVEVPHAGGDLGFGQRQVAPPVQQVVELLLDEEVEVPLAVEDAPLHEPAVELQEAPLDGEGGAVDEVALVVAVHEEAVGVVEHHLEDLDLDGSERLLADTGLDVLDDRLPPLVDLALHRFGVMRGVGGEEGFEGPVVEPPVLGPAGVVDVAVGVTAVASWLTAKVR